MGRFLRFRLEIRGSTVEASGAKSEMWRISNKYLVEKSGLYAWDFSETHELSTDRHAKVER